MKTALQFLFIFLFLNSCTPKTKTKNTTYIKLQIVKVEKDFEKTVAEKGFVAGFYQFADSNAVLKRDKDSLIIGKNNIRNYYSSPKFTTATVTWTPDNVIISDAGDMASTYGQCIWTAVDANGKEVVSKGIFHTVWKKQKDNSWKYIWN